MSNKVHKKRMNKQTLPLPLISPSLTKYVISQTIDVTMKNQKNKVQPSEYIDFFQRFQKDFRDNKLSQQFEKALDDSIKNRQLQGQGMAQIQMIKALSRQIKHKMFEDYVNNKKKQQQTKKYSLDNRRYSNMNIPNITKTGLSNENYRRYSAEKIFVSPENQQVFVRSSMKRFYKKFNNKKLYYQMISPIYYMPN